MEQINTKKPWYKRGLYIVPIAILAIAFIVSAANLSTQATPSGSSQNAATIQSL